MRRGIAETRAQAHHLVGEGNVLVNGAPAANPARQVSSAEAIEIVGPAPRFVSRGGEKLDAALEHFGIDVSGMRALDVGASTGGFTDCLLQRGASSVVALDVGHGQLHERLRSDSRVDVLERTNIRHVTFEELGGSPFEVVTVDVAFISLRTVAPAITAELVTPDSAVVALVKPQFEAGRREVSKGRGVVRDPEIWHDVLDDVLGSMAALGAATMGLMVSPLVGAEGNVEFLAWFRPHQEDEVVRCALRAVDVGAIVARAEGR